MGDNEAPARTMKKSGMYMGFHGFNFATAALFLVMVAVEANGNDAFPLWFFLALPALVTGVNAMVLLVLAWTQQTRAQAQNAFWIKLSAETHAFFSAVILAIIAAFYLQIEGKEVVWACNGAGPTEATDAFRAISGDNDYPSCNVDAVDVPYLQTTYSRWWALLSILGIYAPISMAVTSVASAAPGRYTASDAELRNESSENDGERMNPQTYAGVNLAISVAMFVLLAIETTGSDEVSVHGHWIVGALMLALGAWRLFAIGAASMNGTQHRARTPPASLPRTSPSTSASSC